MTTHPNTRRRFLKKSAALASTVFAVPYILPSSAFGANEKIVTGHIGVGGQGNGNLGGFSSQIGAVCDVDGQKLAAAAKKTGGKPYSDYRVLLEQDDLDAVVVSTPDHWHALTTVHACMAGKHVYCEKPLSLTIEDGRAMVTAARKFKRTVQTGSQQRSYDNFRKGCEYVRSGRIGKLEKVLVGIANANDPGKLPPDSDPPSYLDYEFWLGPAKERPYNAKRVHYNFRFWWDYSGGQMTNWGAHHIDIGHWGIGCDDSGPLEVWAENVEYHPERAHEVTEKCRVTMQYADPRVKGNVITMIIGQGQRDIPGGTTFIGSEGTIHVNRGKLSSDPSDILKQALKDDDVHLYDSRNHKGNFIACIKSGELPICDVEIGHRSASACHLANIACRTGERFKWDPVKEEVTDNDVAAAMVTRDYRKPWALPKL